MQYGQVLRDLGRYKEAEEALGRTLELSPNATWAHETLGEVYLAQGRYQDALAEMKKESPSGPMRDYGLALAYHAVGQDHQSDALLNSLISAHPNEAAYQIAAIYAYRGKVNEAFAWLQRARDQHDGGLMLARTDLLLKNLHSDPRWAKFLQSLPPIA